MHAKFSGKGHFFVIVVNFPEACACSIAAYKTRTAGQGQGRVQTAPAEHFPRTHAARYSTPTYPRFCQCTFILLTYSSHYSSPALTKQLTSGLLPSPALPKQLNPGASVTPSPSSPAHHDLPPLKSAKTPTFPSLGTLHSSASPPQPYQTVLLDHYDVQNQKH